MPAIRQPTTTAVRATRAALQQTTSNSTTPSTRQFTASARTSSSHGPQYDPPTGWLFGVRPGEKYQKEGWETPFYYGFCGSIILAGVAYGFKPDTSYVCLFSIISFQLFFCSLLFAGLSTFRYLVFLVLASVNKKMATNK